MKKTLSATDAVVADLYLLYVTTEKANGKTSTWMANSPDGGGYVLNNTPSTKFFRYWTKEQATAIKKSLDKLERLSPWSCEGKTTFKVMTLKSAVNMTIKKMKEQMITRQFASPTDVRRTSNELDRRISCAEKGEPEELPVSFLRKYKL